MVLSVQFWAAAGAAVALNRVLILPTFLCYCDELWWWSLEVSSNWKCRWPGAHNQTLPFRCPVDTIVNLLQVDDEPNKHGVVLKYRESSFLDNPRTPDAIRVFDPLCHFNSWSKTRALIGTGDVRCFNLLQQWPT